MGTWRVLRLTWAVRPWRRAARGWRLAAVAAAVAGSLVISAAPASAADVPPGTGPVTFCEGAYLTLLPNGLCFDGLYGTIRPVTNPPPGGFSGSAAQPATPRRVGAPGGVLAAVEQNPTATVAERSAGALSNGLSMAKSGGRLVMRGVTTVAGVGLAYETGTWLGGLGASALCHVGVSWECMPEPATDSPDFVPNTDVIVGDVGYVGLPFDVSATNGSARTARVQLGTLVVDGGTLAAGQTAGSGTISIFAPNGGTANTGDVFNVAAEMVCADTTNGGGGATLAWQKIDGGWKFYNQSHQFPWSFSLGGAGCASHGGVAGVGLRGGSGSVVAGSSVQRPFYWLPGASQRPPEQDPDPLRTLTTTVTCDGASGSFTVSASSGAFRETDAVWPAIPTATCPDGSGVSKVEVTSGGSGVATKPIATADVPATVTGWQKQFPECAGGGCTLTLVKKGPAGSDLGDCFDQVGRCAGWMADPDRDTDYECQYGVAGSRVAVPLSDCYVYGPTFDAEENSKGIVSGDPVTGDAPVTANGIDPADGGDPGVDGGGSCWPTGYGVFNPASWVLTPIKCALTWAFVPRADVLAGALAEAGGAARNFGPFGYAIDAGAVVTGVIGAAYSGSCTGDAWRVDPAYFVWPCDPPFPGYQYLYALMVVFVVVGGAATAFVIVREAVAPR